ncbi:uracil-DNA glycosylase, partial [Bacillus pumilus]
ESPHPSPFSARNGFFGSRPFSKVNAYLNQMGIEEINWCIQNIE